MAKVIDMAELADLMIASAAAQYLEIPPVFATVDRRVLIFALKKTQGNFHRLTVEKDHSIIIWNKAVW